MIDTIDDTRAELKRLRLRVKELGRDKGNLQLAVDLINRISTFTGLENVVERILQILMEGIGGSNIAIYYQVEEQWQYVDVLGAKQQMPEPDDPIVRQAIRERSFIKAASPDPPKMQGTGFRYDYETWVYPLSIGDLFFGAVRLEGMTLVHAHYRATIDPFIHYTSLVLYLHVSNVHRLEAAYKDTKKAKEDLSEINQLLLSVIDNSPLAIMALDADRKVTLWSPAAERMFGWRSQEVMGTHNPIVSATAEEEFIGMFKAVLSGERITNLEIERQRRDGSQLNVSLSSAPIIDSQKEVRGAMAIVADITERKRAEKALLESEEKYRTVLEASPDPVIVFDIEGKVLYLNPSFTHVFGWSLEELLGKKMEVFIPEGTELETGMMNAKMLAGESFSGVETRRYTKKGDTIPVSVSGSTFQDNEGNLKGSVVNIRDIRAQKRLEAQLQQAQKMEAIGTLAGGIAHDFNNILQSIITNTELALYEYSAGNLNPHRLKEVLKGSNRAADLVKQILTFSRQSERELRPLSLGIIVKEALKMLRSSLPTTVEIRQNIEVKKDMVLADPTQIHQVMMNLGTNAAHAMRPYGGVLEVSLRDEYIDSQAATQYHDLTPGDHLRLTVSDTGRGMAADEIERIFDPFFTTKAPGEGTGMGLAVVHGIIKNLGGDISVDSLPGKGTTFGVLFPMAKGEAAPKREVVAPIPKGNERILIVDDEKTMVDVIQTMLENLGYTVTAKTSSIETLETFRMQPDKFDLIITDMTMPNMTGMDLANVVMKIRPDIPIILCTGFSELIDEDRAKAMDIRAFVMKPVVMTKMAEVIRKALDKKGKFNPTIS